MTSRRKILLATPVLLKRRQRQLRQRRGLCGPLSYKIDTATADKERKSEAMAPPKERAMRMCHCHCRPCDALCASRNGSEKIDPIFTVKAEATDLTQPHSLPLLPSYSRRSLRPRSISLFLRAKGRLRDFIGLRQRIHVSFGICPSEVGTVNGK